MNPSHVLLGDRAKNLIFLKIFFPKEIPVF